MKYVEGNHKPIKLAMREKHIVAQPKDCLSKIQFRYINHVNSYSMGNSKLKLNSCRPSVSVSLTSN